MGKEKTVGIIGGMGPAATAEFMQRVITATPATDDRDHIHMIIDSNPKIPSRIKALVDGRGENPGPYIASIAKNLEAAGADFIVIPCNTAHYYHADAAEAVSIPVSHLIDLTVQHIKHRQPDITKVGILASTAVQNIRLYEPACSAAGLEILFPDNQQDILAIIEAIKAGEVQDKLIKKYEMAIANLVGRGASCLLLACTELSVLNNENISILPVYDTLGILAQHVVDTVKN